MNFFGHAAIAGRYRADPVFVLGAMLPDWCTMLGLRTPAPPEDTLGAGIVFHHVTDRAFHELVSFRAFCRDATAWLDARGVRRGTARAVAHVGVELFLDAALAESEAARGHYEGALAAGQQPEPFELSRFTPEECARLGGLARVLAQRGVTKAPDTALVVTRLKRALATRPRLAIEPRDEPAVGDWVELFRERVVASTPHVMSELTISIERGLAA